LLYFFARASSLRVAYSFSRLRILQQRFPRQFLLELQNFLRRAVQLARERAFESRNQFFFLRRCFGGDAIETQLRQPRVLVVVQRFYASERAPVLGQLRLLSGDY
jgi:hypothetical protein